MHGLIFGTSVHYWQDQPGILRVRDAVLFGHNILARVQYRLHRSALYLSLRPWHTISRGRQRSAPSSATGAAANTTIAGSTGLTARSHYPSTTQSVATVPLLNSPSESSDCRIPRSAAGLAIGARSALQHPIQTLWIHQTRTGVHRAVRGCDLCSFQLELTDFHRAGPRNKTSQ